MSNRADLGDVCRDTREVVLASVTASRLSLGVHPELPTDCVSNLDESNAEVSASENRDIGRPII